MAALCLSASLETLQPLSYRNTLRLQGDPCHCLQKGFQAVVTLSTHRVLLNGPQFIVQGFEVCTPRKPILSADEGLKVPPQPLLSCLGFWAGTESGWKTHSWPLKRLVLKDVSQLLVAHPLETLIHQFHPFLVKGNGTPPTEPWRRKGDGLPAPSERFPSPHRTFEHKSCCSVGCTAPR